MEPWRFADEERPLRSLLGLPGNDPRGYVLVFGSRLLVEARWLP
ncbi:hypothetical protein [Janibacter anophelis]|nr:hypothetical protein [Janibacter anophelis]